LLSQPQVKPQTFWRYSRIRRNSTQGFWRFELAHSLGTGRVPDAGAQAAGNRDAKDEQRLAIGRPPFGYDRSSNEDFG
jgi:hypothetical protein